LKKYDESRIARLILNRLHKRPACDQDIQELNEWLDARVEHRELFESLDIATVEKEARNNLLERDPEAIERKLLDRLGWDELPGIRSAGKI
jgi:hypothetical protein